MNTNVGPISSNNYSPPALSMEVLRRFLRFLIDNIILVVAGAVIACKVARFYGLTFDYKRGIEELVSLFYGFIGR